MTIDSLTELGWAHFFQSQLTLDSFDTELAFRVTAVQRNLIEYLSLAAKSRIDAVVVMTKKDLCEDKSIFEGPLHADYPNLAIEIIDATNSVELDVLSRWCGCGKTIALVGSSGVGKSTIVNSLKGASQQATGGIRESDSKGRHTTTSRSLHQLAGKAILIDTPGMRELQIVDCEEGIHSTFADIDELAKACRIGDCQHNTEPGCAVRQEIDAGKLQQRRLDNYQKHLSEHERNTESIAERHSNDRALGKFYKQTMQGARRFKSRQ